VGNDGRGFHYGRIGAIFLMALFGEGRIFDAQGTCLAVCRARDGELFATQPHCPHRGGPLTDVILGAAKLVRPLHSWTFDLRTGNALVGECGLKTYPIKLDSNEHLVVTT
jgi:nitrite reductase (NADH) small subunit